MFDTENEVIDIAKLTRLNSHYCDCPTCCGCTHCVFCIDISPWEHHCFTPFSFSVLIRCSSKMVSSYAMFLLTRLPTSPFILSGGSPKGSATLAANISRVNTVPAGIS